MRNVKIGKTKIPLWFFIPLAIIILLPICCFLFYFMDASLREVGLLPTYTPTPSTTPTATSTATATGTPTATSAATATPTRTPRPTATATATLTPTATRPPTATALPTATPLPPPTATPAPPTATPAPIGPRVVIVAKNKVAEFVDIQNSGDQPQDLNGWRLVSEKGNQACALAGVLQPGQTLRIHAMTGSDGYNCGFDNNIWNNSEPDPAVLYNAQGVEVSRR
jgi:hypothetical protein